ncbi:Uu.00g122720.m01.CDS01 [Anthostomella pinea]|uniref:Uu.00g122720.m01.CDS01 n=1 Tax=Anthostomella pinea TaxID=933095 RepID=A0AAI8VHA3_9PEZI|nr:Uu.00g122720.m01.CDS01 [Anthostomella pinea]
MPDDVEPNGTEVSDVMSDNENDLDDGEHPIKDDDDEKMPDSNTSPEAGAENSGEVKKKYDPKDPHRPRRKKARRACFACQRAHLTCGDERPCQRCIKRGLAEACQDGVRKKAKYLHDAPADALRPVLGPNYNPSAAPKQTNGGHHSNGASEGPTYFSQATTAPSYPMFTGVAQSQVTGLPEGMPFGGQHSPVTPRFQAHNGNSSAQMAAMAGPSPVSGEMPNHFSTAMFDPSNPAIFNFDLEGLNFGSHYGALEFGMLNHMSSGAAETPPREAVSHPPGHDVGYGHSAMFPNGVGNQYNHMYDQGMVENFMNVDQNSNAYPQGSLQHGLPHAYAIAAAGPTPNSFSSPGTDNTSSPQPTSYGFDKSPTSCSYTPASTQSMAQPPRPKPKPHNANNKVGPQALLGKRQRDPSSIYETVNEPYPYLTGFHNLITFVQRRFSANKTLRIAKSLASIRPSFIACTRHLNRQDLIFMEKCLQRTLFEYEDFMGHCSAPTIVCRRTGEVAAVNKEFIALTGWTKDVLLGKEPNGNANTGRSGSESGTLSNSSRAEFTTPRLKTVQPDTGNGSDGALQPVFIAEFMDDDSVIQFYEDFAQLAFGDSRGHVTRKCRLLKYRTKEMNDSIANEESPQREKRSSILSKRVTKIDGEHGISKLEKDGKIDCTFCWTIKRDVFDIPMLIVMNFLPCYYRTQDQHLAV